MILSRKWLNEFVDGVSAAEVSDKDFADALTLSGSKVETVEDKAAQFRNVVVGRVLSLERHPDSDHMWVVRTDVGEEKPLQIVTGAWNVHVGDLVPVAKHNALLPGGDRLNPFGREGEMPLVAQYSEKLLKETLDRLRAEGHSSIAVITRTQAQADSLSARLENVYRLDGGEADLNYESTDNVVACYHMVKGMEFDAVIVVWPEAEITDGERRRLYTACSRALHSVALLGGGKLIKELGIVL